MHSREHREQMHDQQHYYVHSARIPLTPPAAVSRIERGRRQADTFVPTKDMRRLSEIKIQHARPERTAGRAGLVPSSRMRVVSRSTGGTRTGLGVGYTSKPSPSPIQRIRRQATRSPTAETHTVIPATRASKAARLPRAHSIQFDAKRTRRQT